MVAIEAMNSWFLPNPTKEICNKIEELSKETCQAAGEKYMSKICNFCYKVISVINCQTALWLSFGAVAAEEPQTQKANFGQGHTWVVSISTFW